MGGNFKESFVLPSKKLGPPQPGMDQIHIVNVRDNLRAMPITLRIYLQKISLENDCNLNSQIQSKVWYGYTTPKYTLHMISMHSR